MIDLFFKCALMVDSNIRALISCLDVIGLSEGLSVIDHELNYAIFICLTLSTGRIFWIVLKSRVLYAKQDESIRWKKWIFYIGFVSLKYRFPVKHPKLKLLTKLFEVLNMLALYIS